MNTIDDILNKSYREVEDECIGTSSTQRLWVSSSNLATDSLVLVSNLPEETEESPKIPRRLSHTATALKLMQLEEDIEVLRKENSSLRTENQNLLAELEMTKNMKIRKIRTNVVEVAGNNSDPQPVIGGESGRAGVLPPEISNSQPPVTKRLEKLETLLNEALSKIGRMEQQICRNSSPVNAPQPSSKMKKKKKKINNMGDQIEVLNSECLTSGAPNNPSPTVSKQVRPVGDPPRQSPTQKSQLSDSESSLQPPVSVSESEASLPKKKLVILADSQGRLLANLLQSALGSNYDVFAYIRPGCGMSMVLHDIQRTVKNERLSKEDYLVVIGGSNDVQAGTPEVIFKNALDNIAIVSKVTNVVLLTVPQRYDLPPRYQSVVSRYNKAIEQICLVSPITLCDVQQLNRSNFTQHGLHYSIRGKKAISQKILEVIGLSNFL